MASAADTLVAKAKADLATAKANLAKYPKCYCPEIKTLTADLKILDEVKKGLDTELSTVKTQQTSAKDKLTTLFQGKKTTPYLLLTKPEQLQESITTKYASLVKSLQNNGTAMAAQINKATAKLEDYKKKDEKHHLYLKAVETAQVKLRQAQMMADAANKLKTPVLLPPPNALEPIFIALPGISDPGFIAHPLEMVSIFDPVQPDAISLTDSTKK